MDLAFLKHITSVEVSSTLDRKRSCSGRSLRRFTDSEVSYMISTEGQYTAEELSGAVNHSVETIRNKAYKLDLKLKLERSTHEGA